MQMTRGSRTRNPHGAVEALSGQEPHEMGGTKYIAVLHGPWDYKNVHESPRLQHTNVTLKLQG